MKFFYLSRDKGDNDDGLFIRVTPKEAARLIMSLSAQLYEDDPNTSREEFRLSDGSYFSISVLNSPE